MSKICFAPGVSFNEEQHTYFYRGKPLSGVTGRIKEKLSLNYSSFMEEHKAEGLHVHKAVQAWIETKEITTPHPGVKWLTETFAERYPNNTVFYSEVLVSDFKYYASSVDIIADKGTAFDIYDIKKGAFKRDYVTWQLSVYKYLIEKHTGMAVDGCYCACLKEKEYYPIAPKKFFEISKFLYGGNNGKNKKS